MRKNVQLVFVASIFLSAFLLFLVQPLVTQFLLPMFGGSPAVWNVALVFFQSVLLLGYLYAHLQTKIRSRALAALIHIIVLAIPIIFLPPALPAFLFQSDPAGPSRAVLAALALMVGMPFFALSTNSSLIQHWWAKSGRPGAEDPYWLYGASNLGSLLALLAYPILVGPITDIGTLAVVWSGGYLLFLLVTLGPLGLGILSKERLPAPVPQEADPGFLEMGGGRKLDDAGSAGSEVGSLPAIRIIGWVGRAAVGSSLLLSITMRITVDVGSVPLFWVLLLGTYLVTFILAFSYTDKIQRSTVEAGVVIGLAVSLGLLLSPGGLPFALVILVGLGTLFFGALLCHHDLAQDRPGPRYLTLFYLCISVGGALGGTLNSLLAPLIFDSVAEYPLTLMALALSLHARPGLQRGIGVYLPPRLLGLAAAVGLLVPILGQSASGIPAWGWGVAACGVVFWGLILARYVGFVVVTCILATILHFGANWETRIEEERSFFGVVRVFSNGPAVSMAHGRTLHGVQNMTPELRFTPLAYHYPGGPMGLAVRALGPEARIGVVGLGAGALAALLKPGQEMVFHEIDPLVEEMARKHFTYLEDSPGSTEVVLGDGRITLRDVPDGSFDLLILDAYSSDFVPVHLLTLEALELYLSKIKPDGLLLFHLSNRHAELMRVMKGASEVLDVPVLKVEHIPSEAARAQGAMESLVAAMALDSLILEALDREYGWGPLEPTVKTVIWTDEKASLLSVLW